MADAAIRTEALVKNYGKSRGLAGLDLEVEVPRKWNRRGHANLCIRLPRDNSRIREIRREVGMVFQLFHLFLVKPKLESIITVRLLGFHLGNNTWSDLHNGNRNEFSFRGKHIGHPDFFSK